MTIEIRLSLEYILEDIDHPKHFLFKSVVIAFAIVILVGSGSLLGLIWHYERHGGDPQKRTILNQLIGLFAVDTFVGNFISVPSLLCRLAYGPMSMDLALGTFFVPSMVAGTVSLLILNEITVIRFMSAFWWKQLPPINENFFGLFLPCFNYGIAFLFAGMGFTGGNPNGNLSFLFTGLLNSKSEISSQK